jgi:hypothetical protein
MNSWKLLGLTAVVGFALFRFSRESKPPKFSSAGSGLRIPVLGVIPTTGSVPLYGKQHHAEGDAIFALAFNYPQNFYQRFIGSLKKSGYKDDVVEDDRVGGLEVDSEPAGTCG